ncbi:hypothetical protein Hanom_Chr15g01373821 [Helianthus anomalus]
MNTYLTRVIKRYIEKNKETPTLSFKVWCDSIIMHLSMQQILGYETSFGLLPLLLEPMCFQMDYQET